MTIELLRDLVEKAAYIYNRLPLGHEADQAGYDLWKTLEAELTLEERREAE